MKVSAGEALERLLAGNRRFAAGSGKRAGQADAGRRADLVAGQEPFAIILGCSDSRVPAEIVFDQGLGDLFVIRVAGNIVAPSQIGSVEFAADRFGTRLVMILGHSRCGAVAATLEQLRRCGEAESQNLRSIVERIRPSVEGLLATQVAKDAKVLEREAVRANVRAAAEHLRHGSEVIERLMRNDGLRVVCGEYSLESGLVELLEDPSSAQRGDEADEAVNFGASQPIPVSGRQRTGAMPSREELERRVGELEREVAVLRAGGAGSRPFIRRRASWGIGNLPFYEIALGPDLARGEWRGHAKAVFAVGDLATGVVAVGGLARGVVAIGGLAAGLVSLGGLSIGLLCAIGGLALGSVAFGGGAIGGVAVGGGAAGYYAIGGGAVGRYVVDARRRDPEAIEFFRRHGISLPTGAGSLRLGR